MIFFVVLFSGIIISLSYHIIVLINSFINVRKEKRFISSEKDFQKYPKVSILKPLKGIDDGLEENIKSFLELDYPDYEVIFGFHSESDPAIEIVERLIKEHNTIKTKIVIDKTEIGLNPKINNLNNIYPFANGEIIFISDSNTRVERDFLKKILKHFKDEKVGLVTAAIKGKCAKNIFALFENLHLNSFVFGIVQAASSVANIQITIGKAILIRRSLLELMNGFVKFKNVLAEDHLMGLEVKKLGYKVFTSTITIDNINERWSLSKLVNRHRRWTLMRLKIDPFFYVLEFFTNTTLLAVLNLIFYINFYYFSFAAILLKICFDYLTSRLICSNLKFRHFLFVPLKDLIMGLIWFSPFTYNKIIWRETKLRVMKYSQLMPVKS
ncbi:MAG: glycosyltransferase [Ignavibacteria bacterium]